MLEIKNLTKSFGDKVLFENFSYTFPDTGVYALVGESGRGKTTLLRMIAGLDKSYSGEIKKSEKSVSFAFQEYRLFPRLSALDNVIFANFDKKCEAETEICKSALMELGFSEEDTGLFPDELSGGMKQRVSLARAFVNPAKILLLDEPTKELDEKNISLLMKKIFEEGRRRLVIAVTHDTDALSLAEATFIEI